MKQHSITTIRQWQDSFSPTPALPKAIWAPSAAGMVRRWAAPLLLAVLWAARAASAPEPKRLETVKGRLLFPVGMLQPAPSAIQVHAVLHAGTTSGLR